MSDYLGFAMFPALMLLLLTGFPIAFSMITVALVAGFFQFGDSVIFQLLSKVDDVATHSVLAAVPLFIFIGAMLERSGIAERLFAVVHIWTRRVPGGLALSAILLGTIFAASSGVVGATETVIGMLAVPVMLKHAYDKSLISGTICASGSLGTVIPPSITVVVLGPVAGVSVGDLFAGLLFPGLIMAVLFMLYVVGIALFRPQVAPREEEEGPDLSLGRKLRMTIIALAPTMALIFTVLGTILLGLATPTEAAACGAAGTIILALIYRTLTWGILWSSMQRTASITAMILLIVLGGNMFAGVFFASGGMTGVQSLLADLGLSGSGAVAVILILAFIAGFLLDLISVVLILIPLAMPIVTSFGVDPIWFSVAFLVVLQTSYLTPPMAPSIFYLRAIAPPDITLKHMYRGVLPFIVMQLVTLLLVILYPDLVLWLPDQMSGPAW